MFNLLPQEEQSMLVKEDRLRLVAVTLFFLGALGVIALTALFPSFFLSYQKEIATLARGEMLKREIELQSKDDLSEILKFTEEKVVALSQNGSGPLVYELVADIIRSKTSDIQITGVSFKQAEDSGRNIIIIGQARNRDALRTFEQTLRRVKAFGIVTVPPSNFADAEDIRFSILIKAQ